MRRRQPNAVYACVVVALQAEEPGPPGSGRRRQLHDRQRMSAARSRTSRAGRMRQARRIERRQYGGAQYSRSERRHVEYTMSCRAQHHRGRSATGVLAQVRRRNRWRARFMPLDRSCVLPRVDFWPSWYRSRRGSRRGRGPKGRDLEPSDGSGAEVLVGTTSAVFTNCESPRRAAMAPRYMPLCCFNAS